MQQARDIMKKHIVFCLLLVVLTTGCKEEIQKADPIRPVRVYTTKSSTDLDSRTFPGKVKATEEASLAFRLSGQVISLDVKEGDHVTKGQLIAMLDQRDYKAAVADLQAQLAGAKSVLKEAKLNIDRNTKLIKDKIISQSAFDTAQSTYETSRSTVLSLEQTLRRAKLNLQYTRIEAPFDGVIAKKHTSNHEFVQAKEAIVELEDISALDIIVDVPETVWVRAFNQGTTQITHINARFDSLPGKVFPLQIKEYQTNADPGTQTYEITLTMDNTERTGVHPGMTAEISGSLPEQVGKTSVSIPLCSVTGPPQGKKYVWVLDKDNTVHKREVEIGRIAKGMAQVVSGMKQDETLVVAGVNSLREGQVVKILEGRIGGRQ